MKSEFEDCADFEYDEGLEWLSIPRFTFRYQEVEFWRIEYPENATYEQKAKIRTKFEADERDAFKNNAKQEARAYLCKLETFWRSLIDKVESETDVLRLVDESCPLF